MIFSRPLVLLWSAILPPLLVAASPVSHTPSAAASAPLGLSRRALPRVCRDDGALSRLQASPSQLPGPDADCQKLAAQFQHADDATDFKRDEYVFRIAPGTGAHAFKTGACSIVLSPSAGAATAGQEVSVSLKEGDFADIMANAFQAGRDSALGWNAAGRRLSCTPQGAAAPVSVDWFVYNEPAAVGSVLKPFALAGN